MGLKAADTTKLEKTKPKASTLKKDMPGKEGPKQETVKESNKESVQEGTAGIKDEKNDLVQRKVASVDADKAESLVESKTEERSSEDRGAPEVSQERDDSVRKFEGREDALVEKSNSSEAVAGESEVVAQDEPLQEKSELSESLDSTESRTYGTICLSTESQYIIQKISAIFEQATRVDPVRVAEFVTMLEELQQSIKNSSSYDEQTVQQII
jgi:hypothetical protein